MQENQATIRKLYLSTLIISILVVFSWSFSVASKAIMIEVEVTPTPSSSQDTPITQENNQNTPKPPQDINSPVNPPTSPQPEQKPPANILPIPQPESPATPIESISAIEAISNFRNNPKVRQFTSRTITPTTAATGVLAFGFVSMTVVGSSADILPLMNYFFNAIISALGIRRRKNIKDWGIIYNSLTKTPIDLGIVRLYEASTHILKQTSVSDANGRFYFSQSGGEYYIKTSKPKFVFPSSLTQGLNSDGKYTKLYFGDKIKNKNNSDFNYSIPLDPQGARRDKAGYVDIIKSLLERISTPVSIFGMLFSIFALWVNTNIINLLICLMYLLLFAVKRATQEKPIEPLGYLYDQKSNKPIPGLVVRIFEAKYNKLLETKVTNKKGGFSFLLPDGSYYLRIMSYSYSFTGQKADYNGEIFSVKNGQAPKLIIHLIQQQKIMHYPESPANQQNSTIQDLSIFDYLNAHNKKLPSKILPK